MTQPARIEAPNAPASAAAATERYEVVIVGGGTAGITVAARLAKRMPARNICIVEPSEKHYYQPFWTLVGAGVVGKEATVREEASVIPRGVRWLKRRVAELDPAAARVLTEDGRQLAYDFLIVAPGIQIDWAKVKGLRESLGDGRVCSIYDYEEAERTWEALNAFRGGKAVFTAPSTPIKCGGAPQKIMYLADDLFRKRGLRDTTDVIAAFAGNAIFGVEAFRPPLERIVARKGIDFRPRHDLVAVDGPGRTATFRLLDADPADSVTLKYDLLHVVPPMSAPDFVKRSPLAVDDPLGWAKVNAHTLQSPDYPNVFSLGDASSLPCSRTGAAVRKQAPVLVENLLSVKSGGEARASYDGYASCPLMTSYRTVMLAEFDYDGNPAPSFPLDPTKERYSMYLLKRYLLPVMYWHGMLRGRA